MAHGLRRAKNSLFLPSEFDLRSFPDLVRPDVSVEPVAGRSRVAARVLLPRGQEFSTEREPSLLRSSFSNEILLFSGVVPNV